MNPVEKIIKGLSICRGIAVGKPLFFSAIDDDIIEYAIEISHLEIEIKRYHEASIKSHEEIIVLQKKLSAEEVMEGVNILDAQLEMLRDPHFNSRIELEIRNAQINAEAALQRVVCHYEEKFNKLANSFFSDRFKDVKDIARRIMNHLRRSARITLANIPENSIIFSKEITTSDTAEANISSVAAFVTTRGGVDSHAAIVAKARGTPYVSNIDYSEDELKKHSLAIVDGRTGSIILSPSQETLTHYKQLNEMLSSHLRKLENVSTYRPETYDGYSIRLSANIETAGELTALHKHGGQGVGLFRSEYICLEQGAFPSEEEQYEIYRTLVQNMKGLPIVIRTFDIGGDKGIPTQSPADEMNPYLGCRAIRFLLKEPEIFKIQLRAILRASVYGDLKVLFPMVTKLSELIEAKKIMSEVRQQLIESGYKIGKISVGCMIEVPSAAIMADQLACEADFLSIGTNDLVQYVLAADRGNQAMNALYKPTDPSILRLIKLVVQEANIQGIPVTVCGEIAADPRFTALLLGLGVSELSVATRYLSVIKHAIRSTSIVEASVLVEKALLMQDAQEIQDLIYQDYKKNVPDDYFYN